MPTDHRARLAQSTLRNLRIGAVFAFIALLVAAVSLEALTRVVFDRNGMHFGIEMWKYAKEIKRRSAIAAIGHEHAPNRRARLMGVDVQTNSLGLRDREFATPKPAGTHRILVLGDSMTFGWGAAEEDAYPKVLERLLRSNGRKVEVINAGVGNYNTSQEVAYYTARGRDLEPDEVIVGFFVNDAEPTPQPDERLLANHSYAYVVASSLWDAVARRAGLKPSLRAYYDGLYDDASPGWIAARQALRDLSRLCRAEGVRLSIALIPELHSPNDDYPFKRTHELVASVAAEEGVRVIELLPAFAYIPPESLWVSPGDAHPNALAHKVIATGIYEALSTDDGAPHSNEDQP